MILVYKDLNFAIDFKDFLKDISGFFSDFWDFFSDFSDFFRGFFRIFFAGFWERFVELRTHLSLQLCSMMDVWMIMSTDWWIYRTANAGRWRRRT